MKSFAILTLTLSLSLGPILAVADDAATKPASTGMATGKRMHKPYSASTKTKKTGTRKTRTKATS